MRPIRDKGNKSNVFSERNKDFSPAATTVSGTDDTIMNIVDAMTVWLRIAFLKITVGLKWGKASGKFLHHPRTNALKAGRSITAVVTSSPLQWPRAKTLGRRQIARENNLQTSGLYKTLTDDRRQFEVD
ncbi:hypothetical protein BaRGS_00038349 [Batillaria attramentaria]|uniref:Uncharacterized protein n=1 Tax=Batillaria attramentaria TaxID=370345 RepID=A0ABD0J6A1_9CAEN